MTSHTSAAVQGTGGDNFAASVAASAAASASAQALAQANAMAMARARSTTSVPSVPFDGTAANYPGWVVQITSVLHNLDLLDSVLKPLPGVPQARSVIAGGADDVVEVEDGQSHAGGVATADQLQRVKQARMILLCNMKSQEVLSLLADVPMDNAHEVWLRLEQHYTRNTQANKQQLKSEFFSSLQADNESVAVYAARVKKCVLALTALKEAPSNADIVFAFTNGLSSRFAQMQSMLAMMPASVSQMTFEQTVQAASALESQMMLAANARQGGQRAQESAHFAGGQGHGQGYGYGHGGGAGAGSRPAFKNNGGGGGGGRGPCWRCGKDHHKADCPSPPTNFKCGYCSRTGHIESVCQTKAKGGPRDSSKQNQAPASSTGARQAMAAAVDEHAYVTMVVNATPTAAAATQATSSYLLALTASTKKQATAAPLAPAAGPLAAATTTTAGRQSSTFLLDTGATSHFATKAVQLQNEVVNDRVKIEVASGEKLAAPTVGSVKLMADSGTVLALTAVLSHEKLSRCLLSVGAMCDRDSTVLFTKTEALIHSPTGALVLRVPRATGGLWAAELEVVEPPLDQQLAMATALVAEQCTDDVLHCRLGHISDSGLAKLRSADAVTGLVSVSAEAHAADTGCKPPCSGCMKGKNTREPFGRAMSERVVATRLLERVHADLCGPFPPSEGGAVYMLLIVDEASRHVWGYSLKKKSDAAARIIDWCRAVVAQQPQGTKIGEWHTDHGGEFLDGGLLEFFRTTGITATTTVSYTPQHNGIVERMNRTICEKMLASMTKAGASTLLWAEAMQATIHTHNLTVVRAGTSQVPAGVWRPRTEKPSVSGLRTLFCDAWVLVPAALREGKLAEKSELKLFLGYDEVRRGYRMMNVHTRKVAVSRDVRFVETSFTQCAAYLQQEGGHDSLCGLSETLEQITFDNEVRFVELISLQEHDAAEAARKLQAETVPARAPVPAVLATAPSVRPAVAPTSVPGLAVNAAPMPVVADARTKGVRFLMGGIPVAQIEAPGYTAGRSASMPVEVAEAGSESDEESESGQPAGAAGVPGPSLIMNGPRIRKPTVKFGMVADGDLGAEGYSAVTESAYTTVELVQSPVGADRDPANIAEARAQADWPHWLAGMKREIGSMRKHHVWDRVVLPRGARAIGCKWVFRRKYDKDGNVASFKVRLVAQGFAQREGVDFFDTFAPVLHYKSLRVILSLVATLGWVLLQMDVPTAFLNAICKDDVYMKPPAGMDQDVDGLGDAGLDLVCKLNKTLYGIKQAPHEWNGDIHVFLTAQLGYTRCSSDTCVYVRTSSTGRTMIIPLFVDDLFPACHPADRAEFDVDLKKIMVKYEITKCEEASVVLGMRITRDRAARTLVLDQEVYINRLLAQHGMTNCNPAPTPMEERPSKKVAGEAAERHAGDVEESGWRARYGSMVGGLLYAALSTRPDIAYAASIMARSVSNPTHDNWIACKRVLRYLRGTAGAGLTYGGHSSLVEGVTLEPSFCDADWAGDQVDRRSTTGFIVKVNGGTVSWASKKQATVSLSSAESEYMAAGAAVQEILWLRGLLTEMGFPQLHATLLLTDNQSAIAIASDDVHHARTKHIDIRHHFIREHIAAGLVALRWVPTADQEADILTKPLARMLFCKLRERVLGM